MTIKETLKKAICLLNTKAIEEPILKSKILLSNCLNKPKEFLFIHENDELSLEIEKEFFKKIDKLCNNVPLQYITNQQEFMGLNFYVNENVLIPRSDTEVLVEAVINNIYKEKSIKILDMCTGSGIVAVALAKNCPKVEITAIDKSSDALEVAIKNAKLNDVQDKIKFIKSDMFESINEKYDIIVSNPPYIETEIIKTLSKDVQNEPKMALDGGRDGLDFYKIIAKNVNGFLKENGKVFLEIGYNQKETVTKIFKEIERFKNITCIKDLAGLDRVIIAR